MLIVFEVVQSKCRKCGGKVDSLWPLEDGVCDKCLTENFTLEQAKEAVDACRHKELEKLYEQFIQVS